MAAGLRALRWRWVGRALLIAIGAATMLILAMGVVTALGLGGAWAGPVILVLILWGPVWCLSAISWIWLCRELSAEAAGRGWDKPRRRKAVLWLAMFGPMYIWYLRRAPVV